SADRRWQCGEPGARSRLASWRARALRTVQAAGSPRLSTAQRQSRGCWPDWCAAEARACCRRRRSERACAPRLRKRISFLLFLLGYARNGRFESILLDSWSGASSRPSPYFADDRRTDSGVGPRSASEVAVDRASSPAKSKTVTRPLQPCTTISVVQFSLGEPSFPTHLRVSIWP